MKNMERKEEAKRLVFELKRSILDIKTKKKEVRRESIINKQYNKMINVNDNKFKVFMKGMRGYKRVVDHNTQISRKDKSIAPIEYRKSGGLGNLASSVSLASIEVQ